MNVHASSPASGASHAASSTASPRTSAPAAGTSEFAQQLRAATDKPATGATGATPGTATGTALTPR